MSVPTFAGPYANITALRGAAVAADVSIGWTNADSWEIAQLPPGFTFDGVKTLGGIMLVDMNYSIAIRGVNADGPAPWENLLSQSISAVISWVLYGAPTRAWAQLSPAVADVAMYVKRVQPTKSGANWPPSVLRFSPAAEESTAVVISMVTLGSTINVPGGNGLQFYATEPGWELLVE